MSDEIRKGGSDTGHEGDGPVGPGGENGRTEGSQGGAPRDDELFTPQGGGGGTGAAPLAPPVDETPGGDAARGLSLPQVGPETPAAPSSAGAEEEDSVSSFRLLMTLGVAGAIAGALLVFVYLWSQPLIDAENARVLQEAVTEVLKGPDRFESVFLVDGELVAQVPEGVDTLGLDKVFLGYDQGGAPVGFAMVGEGFGFQDLITVIFGYDPAAGELLGMKVLRHSETPGLGDKIVRDLAFVGEFDGVQSPVEGVKPNRNTGDPHQVDMITGVTISSAAVIRIINERIAELGGMLEGYAAVAGAPPDRGAPRQGLAAAEAGGVGGNGGAQEEEQ